MRLHSSLLIPALLQSVLAFVNPLVSYSTRDGRHECTVVPNGNKVDDVPNILAAFSLCGRGGKIIFPEQYTYWIGQRLNPVVEDVEIEWRGTWLFSDDLTYWRNNSYLVPFQNHRAGFILSGSNIRISGYSTGNIHGNGDVWYTTEAGNTKEGRPMPFVFWNVSSVTVSSFSIIQPQLWALNIMNGTHMTFTDIYVNATATQAPWGKNWVQNTDGFDTMDASNITLTNLVYQGGDDCVAIKPRSYNITLSNILCRGGNGIAIGSLGQYQEDSSVSSVSVKNVTILRYNEDMHNSAYIKTWVGIPTPQDNYESGGQPRGGGWGTVSNITFSDFYVQGADSGPAITQDNGNNGSVAGSSKMLVRDIRFVNFSGWVQKSRDRAASVSCSKENPCYGIEFEDVGLQRGEGGPVLRNGTCKWTKDRGVKGLAGC